MSDLRLFFAWCADQHLAPLALQRAQIKRYVRCMQEILEIISHFVWLYYCFPLSFREVQEMMLQRGVVVSHETIRQWCAKFGQTYANELRRRRARPGDKWHLDEVFIKINGALHYLWRALDQHGEVLDILVHSRRNAKAAKRFFRPLINGLRYVPRGVVPDKLARHGSAPTELTSSAEHQ